MATLDEAPAPPKKQPVVIDLASDSDDDPESDTIPVPGAPRVAEADAETAQPPASKAEDQLNDPFSDDDEVEDGQESDGDFDFSDAESLIADWCASSVDNGDLSTYQGDKCTPEERVYYRNLLHSVGPEELVRQTIEAKTITAKKLLTAFGVTPPFFFDGYPDERYYRMLGVTLSVELMKRPKLAHVNTIDDVVTLLQKSSKIMVITGAGISTSLGIPDFRSEGSGFYAKMREKGYDEPEIIFDLDEFKHDPRLFYENCGDTFPLQGVTSPTHAFIGLLQAKEKLLRNYTQNIDNVEAAAGIKKDRLIQCHGSWATATCQACGVQVDGSTILAAVKAQQVPHCTFCDGTKPSDSDSGSKRKRTANGTTDADRPVKKRRRLSYEDSSDGEDGRDDIPQPGVMKPDITFFREKLPDRFFDWFTYDRHHVDLVLVVGTSMKVAPVSEMPNAVPRRVPHVYISRDPCRHINFDVTLLGDCDTVVAELARRAGWEFRHDMLPVSGETTVTSAGADHVWRVERAEKTEGIERVEGVERAEHVESVESVDKVGPTEGADGIVPAPAI